MIYYFCNPKLKFTGLWGRLKSSERERLYEESVICLNCARPLGKHCVTSEGNGLICRPQPSRPDAEALDLLERLDRLSELVV